MKCTSLKWTTPYWPLISLPFFPVHYEADENGYRVTSMETEEIGSGPVTNKEGKAFVQSLQHGFQSTYAIMGKQGAEVATISSICISEHCYTCAQSPT